MAGLKPPKWDHEQGAFVMGDRVVPLPEAAMQFFVEAMRANTTVLENVSKTLTNVQHEQRDQLRLISDVRERMIRLEAQPRIDKDMEALRDRIAMLERENAHEDGRAATWAWIGKYFPALATIIFSIIAAVYMVMAATGRLYPPTLTDQVHAATQAEKPEPRATPSQ